MITRISKIFRQKEAGFTLIELLVAVVLVSIIAIGASAGIYHLLGVNSTNANTVTVTTNINSATDYLRDDVLVSKITVTTDPKTGDKTITGIGKTETEWLWLEWTWPDGAGGTENHRVAYQIEDNKLYRTHKIYNSSETLSETRNMIAQYIDADLTDWELIGGSNTVEITISASIDGYKSASETRTIQVTPRMTS